MPFACVEKDPSAELTYTFDWTKWLKEGDSIATSQWEAEEGIDIEDVGLEGNIASVKLSGGTVDLVYEIVNTVVTSDGLTDQRTLQVEVRNK